MKVINMFEQEVYSWPDSLPYHLAGLEMPSDAIEVATAVYSYGPMNERVDRFSLSSSEDQNYWVLWRSEGGSIMRRYDDEPYYICGRYPKAATGPTKAAATMLESFWLNHDPWDEAYEIWDDACGSQLLPDGTVKDMYRRIWDDD